MTATPPHQPLSLSDARAWCRDFTAKHQENFVIAARWLLPEAVRDAYYALYAFARGADDRADVAHDTHSSHLAALAALEVWEQQLELAFSDDRIPAYPAFIALQPVVRQYSIEKELFSRMISAFRQDQTMDRYESWTDLRQYTAGSADPVGRWILRVHGHHDPAFDVWSDSICTGLQLVNFIQDCREDFELRDRVYLPHEEMRLFNVDESMISASPTPKPLRDLLRFEAKRAEQLFDKGKPLLANVDLPLRRQLILFHGGGRLALHALRRAEYDVSGPRITAGRFRRLGLQFRALRGKPL